MDDRITAIGEVDGDLAKRQHLVIAEYDGGDPAHLDLARDRCRRLIGLYCGRVTSKDGIVSLQSDMDDIRAIAALNSNLLP